MATDCDSHRRVCKARNRAERDDAPRVLRGTSKKSLSLVAPKIGEPVIRRVQQLRQVKSSRHNQGYIKTVPSGRKVVAVPVARPGLP